MKALVHRGQSAEFVDVVDPDISTAEIADRRSRIEARRLKFQPPVNGIAFLSRLTDSEYTAIMQAAQAGVAAGQPQLARWIDMLRLNGAIDINGDAAIAAKAAVVAGGLLTQQRADLIFSVTGEPPL